MPACSSGLSIGTHGHDVHGHFPGWQMGTAGPGKGLQKSPAEIFPAQVAESRSIIKDVTSFGFLKVYFSLRIPAQQLFITCFLLLEKLLCWHGNIPILNFYPCSSFQLLRMVNINQFTSRPPCHYSPYFIPFHGLVIKLLLTSIGARGHPIFWQTLELGTECSFRNTCSI